MPLPTGGSNISSNTTLPGPGGLTAVTPCYRCSYCQRGFTSQCGGALGGYKYTVQTFMALTGRPWMDETLGAAR